ncbi:MAG: hypothetical protein ACKV0T_08290 [Planctomycetales bacterium]
MWIIVSLMLSGIAVVGYQFRAMILLLIGLAVTGAALCGGAGIKLFPFLILLSIATAVCRARRVGYRGYIVCCLGLNLGAFAWAMLLFVPQYRERQELLEENPIVDVEERLAYEHRIVPTQEATSGAPTSRSQPEELLASRSLYSIKDSEDASFENRRYWGRFRERALPSLLRAHRGFVSDFIQEDGFGVVRTRRLPARREYIDLSEPPELELPALTPSTPDESPSESVLAALGQDAAQVPTAPPPPPLKKLTTDHLRNLLDFVNPDGFGYVINRQKVIGFQSHGFRKIPTVPAANTDTARWEIERFELVSLLKHDPPAAYVSRHVPRMEELRDAPTRPLDPFELDGLSRLREGEELVVSQGTDELRMLGALRAFSECLRCHQVKADELLGAFSYRLRPAGARRGTANPIPAG